MIKRFVFIILHLMNWNLIHSNFNERNILQSEIELSSKILMLKKLFVLLAMLITVLTHLSTLLIRLTINRAKKSGQVVRSKV